MRQLLITALITASSYDCASATTCEKVVVTGDINWPPYSYLSAGMLTGAGVDLTTQLFAELDIPVESKHFSSKADLGHAVRYGDVDILIGTYDTPEVRHVAQLLTPAYFDDAVDVLVTKESNLDFKNWNDLIGRMGMALENAPLTAKFQSFADNYLFLRKEPSLRFVLKSLVHNHIDFVVGSSQTLQAGMHENDLYNKFNFLHNHISDEPVYIGISKNSACAQYTPYLKKRLKALKENGRITTMVKKHTEGTVSYAPIKNAPI